jgi:polar amino acid transport system substrate-binding protein
MRIAILVGLGCLLWLLTFSVVAETPISEVRLAAPIWEGYTNEDGTGIYLEVVRKAFGMAGVDVVHEVVPFKRAVQMMLYHEVDGVIAEYVLEERDCLYPAWHLDVDTITAIFKTARFPEWRGLESLRGRTVGWFRGYDFDRFLTMPVTRIEFDSYDSGLLMLEKDRLDILLDYASDIAPEFERVGLDITAYGMDDIFADIYSYVVFANTARSQALLAIFDAGMAALHASGELDALYQTYYEEDYALPLREIE